MELGQAECRALSRVDPRPLLLRRRASRPQVKRNLIAGAEGME